MQTKPRFRIVEGRPVELPNRESAIDAARRRYGKPFAYERGSQYVHTQGASYWTPERIAALAAANEARRRKCNLT